jgi:hypothetical protein
MSRVGLRSKEPTGWSVRPASVMGMIGQSSGRTKWVTPMVYQRTMSWSSRGRFWLQVGRPPGWDHEISGPRQGAHAGWDQMGTRRALPVAGPPAAQSGPRPPAAGCSPTGQSRGASAARHSRARSDTDGEDEIVSGLQRHRSNRRVIGGVGPGRAAAGRREAAGDLQNRAFGPRRVSLVRFCRTYVHSPARLRWGRRV